MASSKHARDIPGPDKPRFDNMKMFAYGGIFVVAATTATINGFVTEMWRMPASATEVPDYVARVVLFLELLVLTARWIIATHNEFDLWMNWLDNPVQKEEVYGAIFALSLFLGVLLASPHHIVFTTGFISTSFLLNYWTQWLSNDHFAAALRQTRRSHHSETKTAVLKVMEHYWLARPQLARIATMMFFSCMSFALAFASLFAEPARRELLRLSAYAALFLTILVGETVVAWWRHKRKRAIAKLTGSVSDEVVA